MITPPRSLTLVHAVQQPLLEPQFQNLTSTRFAGTTSRSCSTNIRSAARARSRSTCSRLARAIDDLSDQPQPVVLTGSTTAFSTPIQPTMTVAKIGGRHEFTTQTRNVDYTGRRHHPIPRYFSGGNHRRPRKHHAPFAGADISILSSLARRAQGVYVLPTFAWEPTFEGLEFQPASGGGLRVYPGPPVVLPGEG